MGNPESNKILAEKRANVVKKFLVELGVDENKLKNRLVHEEEKLIKYLKNKNFKIISFENKNIKDQIEIILNSNVVIGVHGANLTNTVFKEKGGSVIELFPFDSIRDGCYYEYIAEQRKLKFFRINCKENNNGILVNYS